MRIEDIGGGRLKVHVDAGELDCNGRPLPYATCLGVVDKIKEEIDLYIPAASRPRGYRKAAMRVLMDVAAGRQP